MLCSHVIATYARRIALRRQLLAALITRQVDLLGYLTFAYAAANPVTGTVTVNAGCRF